MSNEFLDYKILKLSDIDLSVISIKANSIKTVGNI